MKLIISFILLLSAPAYASLETFILGVFVGNMVSTPKTEVVYQDEFSMVTSQIQSQIPARYSSTSPSPSYSFEVSEPQKLAQYFALQGYSVNKESNEDKYKEWKVYVDQSRK